MVLGLPESIESYALIRLRQSPLSFFVHTTARFGRSECLPRRAMPPHVMI